MPDFDIDITDRQTQLSVDVDQLRTAIKQVLADENITSAEISVALVDDAEIRRINRDFLRHDYPTDVISFVLNEVDGLSRTVASRSGVHSQKAEISRQERTLANAPSAHSASQDSSRVPQRDVLRHLEGELIVSAETAAREAAVHGWKPADELLLYIVHGTLHLCGYDDLTDAARPIMRDRERQLLLHWNLTPIGLEV